MIRPLYKAVEPFLEVKAGHGYVGVVMYDDTNDLVQCHICGKWFQNVMKHCNWSHDVSASDYKDRFGLAQKLPVCSKKMMKNLRRRANKLVTEGKIGFQRPHGNHYKHRRKKHPASYYNKLGLCDLQKRARYEVVKKIVGRDPTLREIQKHDKQLYNVCCNRRQNLNGMRKSWGLKPITRAERHTIPDTTLIAILRKKAKRLRRLPKYHDFKAGETSGKTFLNHFGSWRNTLQVAGLS